MATVAFTLVCVALVVVYWFILMYALYYTRNKPLYQVSTQTGVPAGPGMGEQNSQYNADTEEQDNTEDNEGDNNADERQAPADDKEDKKVK
jgi:hypothetical protein